MLVWLWSCPTWCARASRGGRRCARSGAGARAAARGPGGRPSTRAAFLGVEAWLRRPLGWSERRQTSTGWALGRVVGERQLAGQCRRAAGVGRGGVHLPAGVADLVAAHQDRWQVSSQALAASGSQTRARSSQCRRSARSSVSRTTRTMISARPSSCQTSHSGSCPADASDGAAAGTRCRPAPGTGSASAHFAVVNGH